MKKIAITGYKRPQYFETMLQSLIKNDLNDWEIYIQLEPSEHVPFFFEIANRLLKQHPYFIAVNPHVLGVDHNPYFLLEKIFISGTLCCIYLEEDFIVSPDITQLANWYLKQDHTDIIALNLIMGSCNSAGFLSNPEFPESLVKTKSINSLGLIFTHQQWNKHIQPHWLSFPEYALTAKGQPVEGWDNSIYHYLMRQPKLHTLQPVYSRVNHIGEKDATHITSEFQKLAFADLTIYQDNKSILTYHLCNDYYQLPYYVRSHINLWNEMTEALIHLRQINQSEAELNCKANALNFKINEQDIKINELTTQINKMNTKIEPLQKIYRRFYFFLKPLVRLYYKFQSV